MYVMKLTVYSEVVDRVLIAKIDDQEIQQYMEHQRNRSSSDNSHSSQVQKGCVLAMSQNKKKIV